MVQKEVGILLVILILVIPLVFAIISVTYEFKDKLNGDLLNKVDYNFYSCDGDCNNPNNLNSFIESNSGNNNNLIVSYPSEDTYVYYFYKIDETKCFYPYQSKAVISTFNQGNIKSINFEKKPSCQASISSVNVVGEQRVGSTLTISATVQSPFQRGTTAPSNFVPPTRQDYYKADTKIDLLIDGGVKQTVTKNLLIDTSETVQFNWLLSSSDLGLHTIKIKSNVIDCQCQQPQTEYSSSESNVNILTQPTQPECDDGRDNDGDGLIDMADPGCSSTNDDNEYNAPTTNPCTSLDWECTTWSTCTNSEQTRTCTKTTSCDGETGKPLEAQSCTQCSDNYDNDNDNKIDLNDPGCSSTTDNDETDLEACPQTGQTCPNKAYEKCPTGHPKCSCTGVNDLKAYYCSQDQTCPGTSLTHNDPALGTCCSVECVKQKDSCTQEHKIDYKSCPPTEDGCVMKKTCKNGFWTECEKADKSCVIGESCQDGTLSGKCSNQTIGSFCFEGTLINYGSCIGCKEDWYCKDWTPCDPDYKTCLTFIDLNKCNTTIGKPISKQPCSYKNPITDEEYIARLKSAEGEIGSSEGSILSKEQPTDVKSILNQLLGIPKSFKIKVGFETPFVILIIAIFLTVIFMHYFKQPKIKTNKKQQKETTHIVKVNDLLLSVVESLTGDERKVIDKLLEKEGIRINKLRELVGINKTKMEIALAKLEKRQIIKERTDDNCRLFFNDWLK